MFVIGLVGVCAAMAELSTMQWAAIYTIEVTGASEAVGAVAYAVFAGFMVLTRFGGDRVIARFGPVRTVRCAAVLATVGTVLVAAGRVPAVTVAGFALFGVGMAVVIRLVFAALTAAMGLLAGSLRPASASHGVPVPELREL
ncbi:hypothetical protein AB0J42_12740 [Nonomuraea sp. NPDC049649]|uniref:hypothetical protein n=1 Tax=Nonomuraea sp. NPDC049649 TaxID=3155776 RepID=UPI003432D4C8